MATGLPAGWVTAVAGCEPVRPGGGTIDVVQTVDPASIALDIRADTGTSGLAALRLPDGWDNVVAFIDGRPVESRRWASGERQLPGPLDHRARDSLHHRDQAVLGAVP